MFETDRGLASMRTWKPGALFGENEQKSVKMSAKPVRKRERRRRRRKKQNKTNVLFYFITANMTELVIYSFYNYSY